MKDLTDSKFTDKYQIETTEGFKDFVGICRPNIKQRIIRVTLEDDTFIDVSSDHVFVVDGIEIGIKYLLIGEVLETKTGLKKVTNIKFLEDDNYVYDILAVDSLDSTYYANDINNHNCKFFGSSDTLIDGDILEHLTENLKQSVCTKYGGLFTIYEKPVHGALYVLGVDTGKGTKRDSSVVQVLKIDNEFSVKQVGVYKCNTIDTHNFAQVCIGISKYYNDAYMMIENNAEGGETSNAIWYEYECEYIINLDKVGIGLRANRKNKLEANLNLKRYLENGWLEINHRDTVVEMSKYIEVTPNVFKAETRTTHDDCVTALIWGLYFLKTPYFDDRDISVKSIDDDYDLSEGKDGGPLVLIS